MLAAVVYAGRARGAYDGPFFVPTHQGLRYAVVSWFRLSRCSVGLGGRLLDDRE